MQEWFVIFRSYQGSSSLLRAFLKPKFGHVSVVKRSGNLLVLIDPLITGVDVDVVRPVNFTDVFTDLPEDMTVLRIVLPQGNKLLASHFANYLPTCVTCVKALLGIRSWHMTPYGLYKELCKRGAEKVRIIQNN